jgi:hypothetical protein
MTAHTAQSVEPTQPHLSSSCRRCRDEYTWPLDDLHWSANQKAWICCECWERETDGEPGVTAKAFVASAENALLTLERDQLRTDLALVRTELGMVQEDRDALTRSLAAERRLAAMAREKLRDSAGPFVAGCDLLLQIPEPTL